MEALGVTLLIALTALVAWAHVRLPAIGDPPS